jgi:hypothetical protein
MTMIAETGLIIGRGKNKKDATTHAGLQGCLAMALIGFLGGQAQGKGNWSQPPPLFYRLPKNHTKSEYMCDNEHDVAPDSMVLPQQCRDDLAAMLDALDRARQGVLLGARHCYHCFRA